MTLIMPLSDNARTIFDKRYAIKDEAGGPTETPEVTANRVAMNVAVVGALYGKQEGATIKIDFNEYPWKSARRQALHLGLSHLGQVGIGEVNFTAAMEQAGRYRDMLIRRDFFPNSPTWTGAGTGLGQLAACFVLPIDDDLAEGRASIFETLKVAAAIQQTGGGNGFSFGRLRPNRALVKRSMGKASGPVGFLHTYDSAFGWIAQGGTRRGANMGILPVHHPDIRAFIASKTEEGAVENFNISVAITDEYMAAVEKDDDFTLRWRLQGKTDDPVEYEITETIRARDLYDEIIAAAWKLGDPGSLFIDRANQTNPCPTRYILEATNPCGEQWLPDYSNCCLGSINLLNFASWHEHDLKPIWSPRFDWGRLAEITHLAQNFLDDVVDANAYVVSVPELAAAAMGERRIGLGIMGLADAMAVMGLGYDSEAGREFAGQVMEFVNYHTLVASNRRATERGTFEWFKASIYDFDTTEGVLGLDGEIHDLWAPPTPLHPHERTFGRPTLDWSGLALKIARDGVRNACLLTIAPTGTISNLADLGGSGCEPFFALAYERILTQDEQKITLTYANPLLAQALRLYQKTEEEITQIALKVKANAGSAQGIDEIPVDVQDAFPVAADIRPEGHVLMQATLQRFVDNSISKTINLPKSATEADISDVYKLAFHLGCKGITIYRQGSRETEVLSTGTKATPDWPIVYPHPIPDYAPIDGLPSRTFPVSTPFGTAQVYITELIEHPGRPFDVRIGFGKAGNDKLADVEALGRATSIALRAGVPVEVVVDQLEGIGGQSVMGFGPNRTRSVADGIAKLLRRRYMASDVEVISTAPLETPVKQSRDEPMADPSLVCPMCHNQTVVNEQGCQRCEPRLGGCGDFYKCD